MSLYQFYSLKVCLEGLDACFSKELFSFKFKKTPIFSNLYKLIISHIFCDNSHFQILDVSNNSKLVLNDDDLKNYPNLFGFVMRKQSKVEFPSEFFKPIANLQMLNISEVDVVNNLSVIPSTIKVLNFTYCGMQSIDIPHLHLIEMVFLRDCKNLQNFPSIPKAAPLRILDVRYCPLTNATYSHLAPFCQLDYFGLNSESLKEVGHVLKCCGFREWARLRKISGTGLMACYANKTR